MSTDYSYGSVETFHTCTSVLCFFFFYYVCDFSYLSSFYVWTSGRGVLYSGRVAIAVALILMSIVNIFDAQRLVNCLISFYTFMPYRFILFISLDVFF